MAAGGGKIAQGAAQGADTTAIPIVKIDPEGIQGIIPVSRLSQGITGITVLVFMDPSSLGRENMLFQNVLILGVKGIIGELVAGTATLA